VTRRSVRESAETLTTPDGRYLIVRGRLWRATNPNLDSRTRTVFVRQLMDARRRVKAAKQSDDAEEMSRARAAVGSAKVKLGERGPVWWTDGAPDWNRHLVDNTPYAEWYRTQRDDAPVYICR